MDSEFHFDLILQITGFHTQKIINPSTNALTSRYRTFEPDVHTQRT
jgi:hypothetical protein